VGDAKVPDGQAMFEKMFTHRHMAMSGAQYIHYAFGPLDRTNTFCPVQAVIDNEVIGKAKHCLRAPKVDSEHAQAAVAMVSTVMATSHRLFSRHARKAIHAGDVSDPFGFETKDQQDRAVELALAELERIDSQPASHLPKTAVETIFETVPGILPKLRRWQN
jgi:trimethylamine--corrinoid protein Co-methyltransferase